MRKPTTMTIPTRNMTRPGRDDDKPPAHEVKYRQEDPTSEESLVLGRFRPE